MKFGKHLALTSAFLMAFSSVATVKAAPNVLSPEAFEKKFSFGNGTEKYDANQKVRVIVQLEGASATEIAGAEGKRFEDLSQSEQLSLTNALEGKQNTLINKLKAANVKLDVKYQFSAVYNGFSADVTYKDIEVIGSMAEVSEVFIANEYKRPEVKPQMMTSEALVEAQKVWSEYAYKGEGMIVGVVDTGIDVNHPDMVKITDPRKAKLTQEKVQEAIETHKLPGKFYSVKVPYGYNYADRNTELLDLGPDASMHGMHVSGTVGANGTGKDGSIKGIAPEAQILGLKVFGNDPGYGSTSGDVYVKAIEDAVKLGVDVINMSLGSTASFVDPNDPEQKAVREATEAGVVMAISAGNSAYFSNGHPQGLYPYASNPDIGLVGAPGLAYDSLQVASYENSHVMLDGMSLTNVATTAPKTYGFKMQSSPNPNDVLAGKTLDVVFVGEGTEADYVGKDVKGKVVLAARTGGYFYSRIQDTAYKAGAAAVIIRPSLAHGDYTSMSLTNADYKISEVKIPVVATSIKDGDAIADAIKAKKEVKVSFPGTKFPVVNASANSMSKFTSWGVTPNLDFKPEISAPGGQIYSTLQDGQYGLMSGTSMASPHVAGGAALVLQYLDRTFPEFKTTRGTKRSLTAKNVLMSTSEPIVDPLTGVFYSPRRQGAGLMKLERAVTTPVLVAEKVTGEAKVALKEIKDNKFTFTLSLKNITKDEAKSYKVDVDLLTDALIEKAMISTSPQKIAGAIVKINGRSVDQIDVAPGETKDVKIDVDLSGAKSTINFNLATKKWEPSEELLTDLFENGYFAEGFVRLTDINEGTDLETAPALTVPFVGYNGKWDAAPILDDSIYGENTYYGEAGLLDEKFAYLGQNGSSDAAILAGEPVFSKDTIAFSPNGDKVRDTANIVLSFLRNAKEVRYVIENDKQEEVRTIRSEANVRKNYYDGGGQGRQVYNYRGDRVWDGKVNNKLVADGKYYYTVKSRIDFPGAQTQVVRYPIIVDTKAPTVSEVKYDKARKVLQVTSTDGQGSGVAYYTVEVNGKPLTRTVTGPNGASKVTSLFPGDKAEFKLDAALPEGATVKVTAFDYASNKGEKTLEGAGDTTIPYINITAPAAYGVSNKLEFELKGEITDSTKITALKVNGADVTPKLNATTGKWEFATKVTAPADGVFEFPIEATDFNGNKINFKRVVFIDTTPTKLTLELPSKIVEDTPSEHHVAKDVTQAEVTIGIEDNYEELRVSVNGDEIFASELDSYRMQKTTATKKYNLKFEPGWNIFTVKATDLGGNVTEKELRVYRLKDGEDVAPDFPKTPEQPSPAGEITAVTAKVAGPAGTPASATRPVTISGTATDVMEWTVTVQGPAPEKPVTLTVANDKTFTAEFKPTLTTTSGEYKVNVTGKNKAGEVKQFAAQTFTVYNFLSYVKSVSSKDTKGVAKAEFKANETVKLSTAFGSYGPESSQATVILQVRDASGAVVNLSFLTIGQLQAGAANELGTDLKLPAGEYTANVYIWKDFASMEALSASYDGKLMNFKFKVTNP